MTSLLEKELIRDEGWRDRPYKDSLGFLTIGVGHNLSASGLCPEAILVQLRHDIEEARAFLDRRLPWWVETPEPVQRVLINLTFNLGSKLLQFKHTLADIQAGHYAKAADELLASEPWATQVGQRAVRLANVLRNVV